MQQKTLTPQKKYEIKKRPYQALHGGKGEHDAHIEADHALCDALEALAIKTLLIYGIK